MFLKKIELTGFKSFASKTTLEFFGTSSSTHGVTAVVGPNGSGKSNIADAIRWVMGEQSPKNLRGKKSHDVIYAGGNGKSRLNYAQVTLFFDNTDKRIPLAFEEVTISRKIYRDGEGEYFINDGKSRLIDIIDFLAKAGIGKESHCVLNQGMSDAVLNASPWERRSVIEEAAGVKPFQLKRDRSLRKLESTAENLAKTRSIIVEIEPRLRLLKRQAQRAQQRQEVENELKSIQTAYYGWLRGELIQEKFQVRVVLDAAEAQMAKLHNEITVVDEERKEKSKQMRLEDTDRQTRDTIARTRQQLSMLDRERAILDGKREIEIQKERSQKLVNIIPVDLHFVRSQIREFQKKYSILLGLLQEVTTLEGIKSIRSQAVVLQNELEVLYEDCAKATVERARDSLIIESEKNAFRQTIQDLETKRKELDEQILAAEISIRDMEQTIVDADTNRKEISERFFVLEKRVYALQRELDDVREKQSAAKIAHAKIEAHEEDLYREIHSELHVEPETLPSVSDSLDRQQTEALISRLKSRLALIGGIDPSIAQEYRETQERYDFFVKETNDLETAMVSLQGIVHDMDQRIEKEFSRAFRDMNREFDRFFRIMFEGGRAELRIVKPELKNDGGVETESQDSAQPERLYDEAAQAGIEMFVYPPKKKIHQLSMMSGGERSLVSLALLFAIIAYNPPPFVILDEVEAALDEANSRRFSLLVQELSTRTQFIIITHNRETMRTAHILYGVTMGGDGVSKLISVKLDETDKKMSENTEQAISEEHTN